VLVSIVVCEKLPGQKSVTKSKKGEEKKNKEKEKKEEKEKEKGNE